MSSLDSGTSNMGLEYSSPFRIAVLILAHKNMAQLKRLVSRLTHPNVDIYVHLDRKWKVEPRDIDKLHGLNGGRVQLTKLRYSIDLFSWTMVAAELTLIEQAIAQRSTYGYLVLMSGQDYPIRPIDDILAELESIFPEPICDTTMHHSQNWVNSSFSKTYSMKPQRACVRRIIERHVHHFAINRALRGLNHGLFTVISVAKQAILSTPLRRIERMGLLAAGGSQWWILPTDMAGEAIRWSRNRRLVGIFRDVGSADETFFQTVFANSCFANRLTVNTPHQTAQMNRTFTDFFGGRAESSGHPVILTVKHYPTLSKSRAFFARKFDPDQDSLILDLIDKHLLQIESWAN